MKENDLFDDLPEMFNIQYVSELHQLKQIDYSNGTLRIRDEVGKTLTDNEKLILWLIMKNHHESIINDWVNNYRTCLNEWILYGMKEESFFEVFFKLLNNYAKNDITRIRHLEYLSKIK